MKKSYIIVALSFLTSDLLISKEITKQQSEEVKKIIKKGIATPKELPGLKKEEAKEIIESTKDIIHKGGHIKKIKQIIKKPKLNESDIQEIINHIKEDKKLIRSKLEDFFKSNNFYNLIKKTIHNTLKERFHEENINIPEEEFEILKRNIFERIKNGEFLPNIDSIIEEQNKEHEEAINKLKEILK